VSREWLLAVIGGFLGIVQKVLPADVREKWEKWKWHDTATLGGIIVISIAAWCLCRFAHANIGVDCSGTSVVDGIIACFVTAGTVFLGLNIGSTFTGLGVMAYHAIKARIAKRGKLR